MMLAVRNLVRDDSGGAIIEYALVISLVSIAALSSLTAFGSIIQGFFASSSTNLAQVAQQAK